MAMMLSVLATLGWAFAYGAAFALGAICAVWLLAFVVAAGLMLAITEEWDKFY